MILWCIKLILYRLSNRGLQAAVLQRGAGTHCHKAAAVTTCHVSHVSTYPMVAWAGHRSGHAEKLQLWRILSGLAHSVTRCCHVCACGQLVTCHVSPWRGWSSITVSPQVTPAPAGTCGHWRGCSLCCVTTRPPHSAPLLARLGQVSWRLRLLPVCGSSGPLRRMRAAVLVTTDTADCTDSTRPPRPGPPPSTAQLLPQLAASLEPRTHRHPAAASQHLASGPLVQGSCAPA